MMVAPRLRGIALAMVIAFADHDAYADEGSACADAAEYGQVLRDQHKLLDARAELLRCAKPSCPAVVATACEGWLRDVDFRVPSIVVEVVDARGIDRIDAIVSVDGRPTDAHSSGAALALDPGPHDLIAKLGATSTTLHVVAREGERARRVRIELADVAATAPAAAPPNPSRAERRFGPPGITWVLGGIALAGLGTFVVAGLDGAADVRRLEASCARPCPDSELDPAARKFLVADIGLAVGVVAVAAGMFFWWRESATRRGPPAR